MDNNPYQNKDWSLGITVKWFLKKDREATVPCKRCNGQGQFSSWGADPDDDLGCDTCWGSGQVPNPELEPKPDVPEVFRNYMEGYYHKFFETMNKLEKKWKS